MSEESFDIDNQIREGNRKLREKQDEEMAEIGSTEMNNNLIITIYPAYRKSKKYTRIIKADMNTSLYELDKLIRKEYCDEEDIFDFNDYTHLSEFYTKDNSHDKKNIFNFNKKLSQIYPSFRKIKYIFDLGEGHLFYIEIKKKKNSKEGDKI
jgi:hypothetical protein